MDGTILLSDLLRRIAMAGEAAARYEGDRRAESFIAYLSGTFTHDNPALASALVNAAGMPFLDK
ncbi:hypothetical protein [Burkholderia anthina]|uniref:hypothetical protein n=1 Tax=Burkholderia anthina TaxID=179879 RepID=UPI00158833EE|nr:hypothetical protein [Burkholderia anthina]